MKDCTHQLFRSSCVIDLNDTMIITGGVQDESRNKGDEKVDSINSRVSPSLYPPIPS